MRVAFVGLGVMGYPMAGYLARAGHDTVVYNRSSEKAERWIAEYDGASAPTPAEAAAGAEIAFSCVGNDTTASASLAREISEKAAGKRVGFLDAPVSGGQAGAENGQLTVMVGGDADIFDRARPVINCYAKAITLIGPVGSGQLAKMVNQICIRSATASPRCRARVVSCSPALTATVSCDGPICGISTAERCLLRCRWQLRLRKLSVTAPNSS